MAVIHRPTGPRIALDTRPKTSLLARVISVLADRPRVKLVIAAHVLGTVLTLASMMLPHTITGYEAIVTWAVGGIRQVPAGGGGGGGDQTFTPLHTYFLSTTGNDGNNGLTPATAWATPNHSVVCGDVILVQAGTYSTQFGLATFGAVSGCPSSSGGIDGTGGIYFAILLCAGPVITSCNVQGGANTPFDINDNSNWAVEGFYATQNTTVEGGCFLAQTFTTGTFHHIAFINNIANQCGLCGFCTSDVGQGNAGIDQTAVVGNVAFNAAQSLGGGGNCGSGISIIPNGFDNSSGTHIYVAGNFVYNNFNSPTGSVCANTGSGTFNTDGEGIIYDSLGNHSYNKQIVTTQNALWINGSSCIQMFPNTAAGDKAKYYTFGNSCYGDYTDTNHFFGGGEFYANQITPVTGGGGFYSVTNNIFVANKKVNSGADSSGVFGIYISCSEATTCPIDTAIAAPGTSGTSNYIWNNAPVTTTTAGNPNTESFTSNGVEDTTTWIWGTNTYNDPGFASPTSLPTSSQPPSLTACASYATVAACMNDPAGFNVAGHLTPSGGAAGKGYKVAGACGPDTFYPTWLKGVVYLQASGFTSGATITEKAGLITKPCGI